jgi:2-methylcitrate dehydratase PrpD
MKAFDGRIENVLVDWAVNLRFEDLPEQAVKQSKKLLIDTLAAAWRL